MLTFVFTQLNKGIASCLSCIGTRGGTELWLSNAVDAEKSHFRLFLELWMCKEKPQVQCPAQRSRVLPNSSRRRAGAPFLFFAATWEEGDLWEVAQANREAYR